MPRTPILAANWKMHLTIAEAITLASDIATVAAPYADRETIIFAPFTHLPAVADVLGGKRTALGGQNLYFEKQGAFTGEISAPMLKDVGCQWALVGHSERRQYFGETNESCRKKIAAALSEGLKAMYCVGETLAEREAGLTETVVLQQLEGGLKGFSAMEFHSIAVAYEPVWAIGTGKNATPEDAQTVHQAIRTKLEQLTNEKIAQTTRILYGGSVKPDNIKALMAMPDIDGALVGGASLKKELFKPIIEF